jgi:FkbM family methyltransferase
MESTMSHTASWVAKEINDGEYHLNEVKRLGRIPDYSTVLDLGTNIGITAIMIAKLFPTVRVIGVEPMPPNFACALENIHLNGVADRVTILNAALSSDTSSPIKISYSGANSGGSSVHPEFHEAGYTHDFAIQPITVDEIVEHFNVTAASFIKLDCEGCEFDIVPAFPPRVVDIFMKAVVMGEVHERLLTIHGGKLAYVKAFFDAYEGGGAVAKPWDPAALKTPPPHFDFTQFVPKEGDIIKTKGNSVFLVENGTRREFQSKHAFLSRGYDFEKITQVESLVMNKIPLGEPLY